jgi:hypothetical protein
MKMKKRIALLIVLQVALLFNSCSSDSGDAPVVVTPQVPVVINTTIKSYSKDYGTAGETITMTGENFSTKISEIKITFDGVVATILSATATEIVFTLPATEKLLPKLIVTIENRTVTNSVVNNYSGNIGILPIPSTTDWFTIENGVKKSLEIPHIQMITDKILCYSVNQSTIGEIYITSDGGITWSLWTNNYYSTAFHMTKNGEGWSYAYNPVNQIGGVYKLLVGEKLSNSTNYLWSQVGFHESAAYSIYVDDNFQNGTIVSRQGEVHTTVNGTNFAKVYDAKLDKEGFFQGRLSQSTEIDNDHIWVIGSKLLLDPNQVNGMDSYSDRPFILFKNNTTDGWKEHHLTKEISFTAKEICFADASTGFLLINNSSTLDVKLFKTTDGGDTWSPVYNGEKFTKFTFKDSNTGWAILDNKIYKTTNGGVAWKLDYTHDQPIRNIGYKNNVVWAISNNKIIKRYL